MGLLREPVQQRSRQAVEKLLDSAAACFGRHGYDRTTVRAIAQDAGVPAGSLYQFFRDKEAVLDTLTERYIASIRATFEAAEEIDGGDPTSKVIAGVGFIVDSIIAEAKRHPAMRALLASADGAGPFALAGRRVRGALAQQIAGKLTQTEEARRLVVGQVCADISQGLIGKVVRDDGTVDSQLQAHMRRVITIYILDIKENGLPA